MTQVKTERHLSHRLIQQASLGPGMLGSSPPHLRSCSFPEIPPDREQYLPMQTPLISLQEQREWHKDCCRDVHFSVFLDSVWINDLFHVEHSSGMSSQARSKNCQKYPFTREWLVLYPSPYSDKWRSNVKVVRKNIRNSIKIKTPKTKLPESCS